MKVESFVKILPAIFFWVFLVVFAILSVLDYERISWPLLFLIGLCAFLFPDSIHKVVGESLNESTRKFYRFVGVMFMFSGVVLTIGFGFLPYNIQRIARLLSLLLFTLAAFLFFLLVIFGGKLR